MRAVQLVAATLLLSACGANQEPIASPTESQIVLTSTPSFEASATMTAEADDAMYVGGTIWRDARPASGVVRAFVGNKDCDSTETIMFPDDYMPGYYLRVPSAKEVSGCGVPGSIVRFTFNGEPLTQTATWNEGFAPVLMLIVGPAFARYQGRFAHSGPATNFAVEPKIGGLTCGYQLNPAQGEGEYGYHVVVDPAELTPGCGAAGARIVLHLVWIDESGERTDAGSIAEADWAPGDAVDLGTVSVAPP